MRFLCSFALGAFFFSASLFGEQPRATSATSLPSKPATRFTGSLTSGFAETFQLTLGGTFGDGPAWQNRLTLGATNLFSKGDSLSVSGWDTFDTPSHSNDWTASLTYKTLLFKRGNHTFTGGGGVQRWLFPSVKCGAKDWLVAGNLTYQTKLGPVPFLATGDSWSHLSSNLEEGSLVHWQAWFLHDLYKRDNLQVQFRHGPAHTFSWKFYGTDGNRVVRYQTMMVVSTKFGSFETLVRKQHGLKPGIKDNWYWSALYTRSF
jgi:hypothetical protein